MPGYELFGDGLDGPDMPWAGSGLAIEINAARDVVSVRHF